MTHHNFNCSTRKGSNQKSMDVENLEGNRILSLISLVSTFKFQGHGTKTAIKLQGSTPHDQLLIQTSDSFSGLLLFIIGFLVFMVSCVKDMEFQSFFAKGCVFLHISMAVWRFYFVGMVKDLGFDWPRHAIGDIALAISWVFFLVYVWREKYD
ncbi:uncharacterized protein LOC123895168 isoform X1 [Trifolium pratense]|uniref:uncharacterized protein LOC123895168 isoform X1 n=1 Tax=Trifolium pratense TaxID=57577 RepID=UPI001E694BB1|nr:uncharacterized protein LOC123895168 isoform X1 [Trifolium pratense]